MVALLGFVDNGDIEKMECKGNLGNLVSSYEQEKSIWEAWRILIY